MNRVEPTVAQLIEMLPVSPDAAQTPGALDMVDLPFLSPIDLQYIKASDDARYCAGHDYSIDAVWR